MGEVSAEVGAALVDRVLLPEPKLRPAPKHGTYEKRGRLYVRAFFEDAKVPGKNTAIRMGGYFGRKKDERLAKQNPRKNPHKLARSNALPKADTLRRIKWRNDNSLASHIIQDVASWFKDNLDCSASSHVTTAFAV
ncbi:hypothetical protein LEN26_004253 [Aphanomyces euteiches]|nr:hypothetical protein LEN26_004253 [Aphanomyces euteiches]